MHNIENIKNYCINIGTEFVSTEYITVKDNIEKILRKELFC